MNTEIRVGSVVRVTAGKEKGLLFAVIGQKDDRFIISDGRTRRLNKPKHKSKKHMINLGVTLSDNCFCSNRELRRGLNNII